MMPRKFAIWLLVIVLMVGVYFSFKPLLLTLARQQLKQRTSADVITIQKIKFKNFNEIRFLDIVVEKKKYFALKAQEVSFQFRFFNRQQQNLLKISAKSLVLDVVQPKKKILDFKSSALLDKSSNIFLPELELHDLNINAQFKDMLCTGRFSFNIDLARAKVNSLFFNIESFQYRDLFLTNVLLWAKRGNQRGNLNIEKVKYSKVIFSQVSSLVYFDQDSLIFDDLSADIIGGKMSGDMQVKLVVPPAYQMKLSFAALDIARFIEDFELQKKFTMTGALRGQLNVQGTGVNVQELSGNFVTASPGGLLTIKDNSFLENIASRAKVNYDIVQQSLQEYHYTTGELKVSLENDAVAMAISLDGEKGPKNFNIVNHFINTKDGL